ncbi:MAG: hypothetical protein ACM3PE_09140 [Deltaproteobacteria bacterium]
MKKGYVLLVMIMILVLMAGCNKGQIEKNSINATGQPSSTQSGGSESASSGASPGRAAEGQKDPTGTPAGGSKGAEVIVKSGSDVASKDKAVLLNQIDQELDQMIEDINNLEDISDSDLE